MTQAVADAQALLQQARTTAYVAVSSAVAAAVGAGAGGDERFAISSTRRPRNAFFILLPLIIVMSTFFMLMLVFLICILVVRRRRGISLGDSDGPVDLSREDLIQGEGGFEGVESRWLETVSEAERREYARAKEYQLQYPPNSLPTDITLSQFLSIQEKGVSAWSFEPDYETISSVIVHARTEITFLPDPESASAVQSNLPLPKLNEVYYWEAKLFDLPPGTNIAIGLATKPYPPFRLPGISKYSIAYHSNGDKSFNWPFTASTYSQPLKEGDVLGLGYRPRSGTVFFTRNGFRVAEDAFVGLSRYNLFPTVGADGPCSIHINLGQSGFVFIEANVKKWGLAPSVGTLAPPPAYGSERGSILLAAGGEIPAPTLPLGPSSLDSRHSHRSQRSQRSNRRRRKPSAQVGAATSSSPLAGESVVPDSPPPPITPIDEEPEDAAAGPSGSGSGSGRYMSPTDMTFHTAPDRGLPASPSGDSPSDDGATVTGGWASDGSSASRSPTPSPPPSPGSGNAPGAAYFRLATRRPRAHSASAFALPATASSAPRPPGLLIPPRGPPAQRTHGRSRSEGVRGLTIAPPESPVSPNPPTPDQRDIALGSWAPRARDGSTSEPPPPGYAPLDPFTYASGVHIDLPAEVITAVLEGDSFPTNAIGSGNRHERRSRREPRAQR